MVMIGYNCDPDPLQEDWQAHHHRQRSGGWYSYLAITKPLVWIAVCVDYARNVISSSVSTLRRRVHLRKPAVSTFIQQSGLMAIQLGLWKIIDG